MRKIIDIYNKYIFSDEFSFEARVLNMVCAFGIVAVFAASAARLIEGSHTITLLAMFMMGVAVVAILYVSNRFGFYRQATWITIIAICDVCFPLVFMTNGGIDSGMSAYFVMCAVVIFLLSSGRTCFILVSTNIIISVSCYMINFYNPSLILPLNNAQRYVDNIQSFVISGIFCGFVIKTLSIMYHEEKKKAELASSAKGYFLAQMSHEMRTPMNAIIGMTSIAQSAADPERKDYCLNKISAASAHLLGVINDILDMSKIEANKFSLSPEEFDFEGMLQRAVNVINFRIDEKNQDLKVLVDEKIPRTLIGDDQRMAQVITNLLSNAVKFTPESGSIRLEAALKEEKDDACAIEISVTDNGIGISAEQQERLFTSFEQADNTTSRKFGGTGLGLAISKRIVEMMHGSIWVESEPGKGSTFAFTVWMRHLGDIGRKRLLDSGVNLSNMRVLAVDDDPWVLEYFSEIMGQFGMPCSLAEGGEEALKLIQGNGGFDLYFIDWKMPGIDGIELTRRIKEGGRPKSVVIMISAMEWGAIADEAKLAGVDKFLQKPLFPSAIADCINECLGVGSLRRETDSPCGDVECFDGCTALLAEDVEINREIAVTLFEPTRLKFECAENGAEAVRMFSESPDKYDVILMDVQMPEMDGYEATRRIRGLGFQKAKDIPILAMTANVFRGDIEKCIASGMTAHIGKPIVFDEAVRKLRLCLAKKN